MIYFQFLIEDLSTEILVGHVMKKLQTQYSDKEILYDTESFGGIGHLRTSGNLMERKGGNLLNNLHMYLRGFDRSLAGLEQAAIIIVLDNDRRDPVVFREQLENVAAESVTCVDHVFCVAIKEMEAWLLGDESAIMKAYPLMKKKYLENYQQDGICDTWEVLANMIYPGGLAALRKKTRNSYSETGAAKCEWADKIGAQLNLNSNRSPSFQFFLSSLKARIEAA